MSFSLVGWLETIETTLNRINLIPGRSQFTLWAVLKGLVIVTAFVIITSLISRAFERRVMRLEQLAVSTRIGISKFTYFLLVGLGLLLGINSAGVDVTTLNVLTGAIGIGLGFGLQAIASNFVSGFVLLMDKSIKPGDVISFTGHTGTSTENFGWVQELRGRYVVVRDRDGVETLVPNQNLITNSVINWSYSDRRVRIRLPVVVSYDDDPEIALKLLFSAARAPSPHPARSAARDTPDGVRGLRDAPGSALLDRRPHEWGQQRALGRQSRDLPDLPRERREDPGGAARAAHVGPQPQYTGRAQRGHLPGTQVHAGSATGTGTGAGGRRGLAPPAHRRAPHAASGDLT